MKRKTILIIWLTSGFITGVFFGLQDMKIKEVSAEVDSLKEELDFYYEYAVYLEEKIMVVDSKLPK